MNTNNILCQAEEEYGVSRDRLADFGLTRPSLWSRKFAKAGEAYANASIAHRLEERFGIPYRFALSLQGPTPDGNSQVRSRLAIDLWHRVCEIPGIHGMQINAGKWWSASSCDPDRFVNNITLAASMAREAGKVKDRAERTFGYHCAPPSKRISRSHLYEWLRGLQTVVVTPRAVSCSGMTVYVTPRAIVTLGRVKNFETRRTLLSLAMLFNWERPESNGTTTHKDIWKAIQVFQESKIPAGAWRMVLSIAAALETIGGFGESSECVAEAIRTVLGTGKHSRRARNIRFLSRRKIAFLLRDGMVPSQAVQEALWTGHGETPAAFKTMPEFASNSIRAKFYNFVALLGNEDRHVILACWNLFAILGDRAGSYITSYRHVNQALSSLVHDLGIQLIPGKHHPEPIWKFRAERDRESVRLIAAFWGDIEENEKVSFSAALQAACRIQALVTYTGVQVPELAVECASHSMTEEQFHRIQAEWMSKTHSLETVPAVTVQSGEYTMTRIKRDPRALFLGEYTDCCQSVGGAGQSCALHGLNDPDGAFFVVEKAGEIVAQSWAWRSDDTLVFDNVETKGGYRNASIIRALYEKCARMLLGKLGIKMVLVGIGHSDMDLFGLPRTPQKAPPVGVYSDAKVGQMVLAAASEVTE